MDFAQIAGWVNKNFMPLQRFVKTSRGAQDNGNAVQLSSNGKLDASLLGTHTHTTANITDYATGTFTPGLRFGGGNTGMSFTTSPTGSYTKIGRLVFFTLNFTLSAKGSSTGQATIINLPFTSIASYAYVTDLRTDTMTLTGDVIPQGYIAASGTTIFLEVVDSGTRATMTATHFTDTTAMIISGVYQAA